MNEREAPAPPWIGISAGRISAMPLGVSIPHTEQPGGPIGQLGKRTSELPTGSGWRASGNVRIQRKLRSDASVAKVSTAKGICVNRFTQMSCIWL